MHHSVNAESDVCDDDDNITFVDVDALLNEPDMMMTIVIFICRRTSVVQPIP
jgi:hypothetical protein